MRKTFTNTRAMKNNILNFMDDLYKRAQKEDTEYPPVESGTNIGVMISSKIAMTKSGERDLKNKICIWDPAQLKNEGNPHLVILLTPFASKFYLEIKRIPHEVTNGLLNNFIDTISSIGMRMIDHYDRVVEE